MSYHKTYDMEPVKVYFTPKEVAEEVGISVGMVYILSRMIDRKTSRHLDGKLKLNRKEIEILKKHFSSPTSGDNQPINKTKRQWRN